MTDRSTADPDDTLGIGVSPSADGALDFAAARKRADHLVAQLTLDEKLGLVASHFPFMSPQAAEHGMPMCSGFTPAVPRLDIPALTITDASLGVANLLEMRPGDEATALPASLATGASFDPGMAFAGGAMIADEARAKTFNVLLGGGINLTRDPWAGRNFEYYGEDPLLSGILGGAAVKGVQSRHIACTVKHFVLNPQETGRMAVDARIADEALRESDLLAFEIAIEIGQPASVMTAYNLVNGHYASEHDGLINGVLKGAWGYGGWVMSDWGAVHSTEKAALAGLDQESGFQLDERLNDDVYFTDRLRAAIEEGLVPRSRLDDMVSRILTGMIACGAMDNPVPSAPQPCDFAANGKLAQQVAEAGAVLLRNERGTLPLAQTVKRIAVIGGHADVGVLSGGGSSQVRSVGGAPVERSLDSGDSSWFCRLTYHASSPLDALRARAPHAVIEFASGADLEEAAALAAQADVALVFATQWRTEATDLESLALPDRQDALIEVVAAANPSTVVVLQSGGAVLMPWLDRVPAVLAVWYPGQRGGEAIARLVFGDANPSGRLPLTFPAHDGQAPRPMPAGLDELRARDAAKAGGNEGARIARFAADYDEGANVGYRWFESTGTPPLFPFGFGLSYTRFEYADLEIVDGTESRVRLTVSNVGPRDGADVPQVYVRATDRDGTETWRLAGFKRVELSAGSSARVEIALEPRTFANWHKESGRWTCPRQSYEVAVGRSATDHVLMGMLARQARVAHLG